METKEQADQSAQALIANLDPSLSEQPYVFCTLADDSEGTLLDKCRAQAVSIFREAEGTSFILLADAAADLGFDNEVAMRCITLKVYSKLGSVGLTAAVSTSLAEHGIPCNMVAAYHHDYVFVPARFAQNALTILEELVRTMQN